MKKRVGIIGAGINGLCSAWSLLEAGYSVEIYAASFPPNTTSNKAAALWYPFRAEPEGLVLKWSRSTYFHLLQLMEIPQSGIHLVEQRQYFAEPRPIPFWREIVADSFRRLTGKELKRGYVDGYTSWMPLVETPVHIPFLIEEVKRRGATFHQRTIKDLDVFSKEQHPIIVNCSGLGARELCDDDRVYPIRGQIVRTSNPGVHMAEDDEEGPLAMTYIIPRKNDIIIGGTTLENDWSEEVHPKTAEKIHENACVLTPELKDAVILEHYVGLRPARDRIRLEAENLASGVFAVHNYGHGGSGFTVSWGCAEEVVRLVQNFSQTVH